MIPKKSAISQKVCIAELETQEPSYQLHNQRINNYVQWNKARAKIYRHFFRWLQSYVFFLFANFLRQVVHHRLNFFYRVKGKNRNRRVWLNYWL